MWIFQPPTICTNRNTLTTDHRELLLRLIPVALFAFYLFLLMVLLARDTGVTSLISTSGIEVTRLTLSCGTSNVRDLSIPSRSLATWASSE